MAAHIWNSANDYEYAALTNCKIDVMTDSIVLDNALSGTVISDIRDSTIRINNYKEIIPKVTLPAGTTIKFYVRAGRLPVYLDDYPDLWTNWIDISTGNKIVEYTLSLTNSRIVLDYDIKEIINIYYSTDIIFLQLAAHLTEAFLKSLNEYDPKVQEQYIMLWSALSDYALSGFAKTDYDPGTASRYAAYATFVDNVIKLKNNLPEHNVPIVIEYLPRYYCFLQNSYRYFQWKAELTSDALGKTPVIYEFVANYALDYQKEIENEFPGFFRRL